MSNISNRLKEVSKHLKADVIADVAYKKFVEVTPKNTGNAKDKTKKQKNTINANYPYASRLNEGYSKKAPKGMVEPTIDHIRIYIKQSLGIDV